MATLDPAVTLMGEATAEDERDKKKPDILRTLESIKQNKTKPEMNTFIKSILLNGEERWI